LRAFDEYYHSKLHAVKLLTLMPYSFDLCYLHKHHDEYI
jgi:hypothetical protein